MAGKATPELRQITGSFQRAPSAGALNPDADFFDCGGQSLTAVSLCADLRHELGIEIDLAQFSPYERLNASTIGFP